MRGTPIIYTIYAAQKMRLPIPRSAIRQVMNRGKRKYSLSSVMWKKREAEMKHARKCIEEWFEGVYDKFNEEHLRGKPTISIDNPTKLERYL